MSDSINFKMHFYIQILGSGTISFVVGFPFSSSLSSNFKAPCHTLKLHLPVVEERGSATRTTVRTYHRLQFVWAYDDSKDSG